MLAREEDKLQTEIYMFKSLQKSTVGMLRIGFLLEARPEVLIVWWIRIVLPGSESFYGLLKGNED